MSRDCPDCKQPLMTENFHTVELELCPECEGIWFDAEELKRLLAADPIALIALEEHYHPHVTQQKIRQGVLLCPGCDGILHLYHYQYDSPIEVQACLDCGGFWVEENQLSKMQQWLDTHHHPEGAHAVEEKRTLTLAHATVEHDNTLQRLANLNSFFGLLRRHQPLWLGGKN